MSDTKTSKSRAQERAESKLANPKGADTSPHDVTSLQKKSDEIQKQGYDGIVTDPTPNEHYTVEGVTSGKPTPETDADLYEEARGAAYGNPHKSTELPSHLVSAGEKSERSEFNKGGKEPPAMRGEAK